MPETNEGLSSGTVWDEDQCMTALAQLERLQTNLDGLRLTIPRVVEPLGPHPRKGANHYIAFKQAVVGSQDSIKSFRTQWQSAEVQNLFQHARESLKANQDLSAGAHVPRYGWEHNRPKETEIKKPKQEITQLPDDLEVDLSREAVSRIMEDFRKDHPRINISSKDDDKDVSIDFVVGNMRLRFHVAINHEANGPGKLGAECLGTSEGSAAITRCLSSRPRTNDLKYLLDMIAAYKTTKGSSCAKCGQALDKTALPPTARRSKQVTAGKEAPETVWEALHESCLD